VADREVQELAWVGGLGIARAVRLGAAIELSRRLRARPNGGRVRLSSPEEVAGYFGPHLEALKKEVFRVALLDSQNGLLRDVQVSEGSLSASIVHPREVFRTAILEATAHLILVHNHPSGDPTPSKEDVHLTRQLVEGARLLGLRVHDHVIIGRGSHVSLAQRGLL
jgi:DNA repair protein RadC